MTIAVDLGRKATKQTNKSSKSPLLFSSAEMFKKPASMANSVGAVCSGSTLFASILNSSEMLGNYLQQTASADDIFRCFFFSWRFKG